ncbi:MAG: LPS export ABC transporter periplasmic protein LptC [Legionellaceae bacterium]|nr:LPS export ABC transporter periplasmic protein LptC [Legionellaceae bacterium]
MNSAPQNALWIFLIMLALAVSGWYFASNTQQYRLDEDALSITADNRIRNLQVTRFDASGALLHQLTTPYMVHIPKDDTNHFSEPRILIVDKKQAPWKIQASKGISLHGGEKIHLQDKVIMEQSIGDKGETNRFLTDAIDYYPRKKFAETQAPIRYQQPGSSVESLGMRAWLEHKHIQLLSRARGRYEPAHA